MIIPVTQPFLPPMEEYNNRIAKLWGSKWLTNNGVFVRELEDELASYLEVTSLSFVGNGTLALQLALKALDIKGEVITTPFSFVATTTAIIWENCEPVFVDIDSETLCIDADKIEEVITKKTTAILATHVYGIPCNVERIEEIAKKHGLKVIYDAAHAFGVKYKGKSILEYGDISTLSFHATKLFHTVEGGGIVTNLGPEMDKQIKLLRSFGFEDECYKMVGINAKNSEFHAAMGLCNLKYIDQIMEKRKVIADTYDARLLKHFVRPSISKSVDYNYAYYPIIFETEQELVAVKEALDKKNIQARRYFYPTLNELPYLQSYYPCFNSEDISNRVLCLPLYSDLNIKDVERIIDLVLGELK
ncbi:DegT/DnrJ/EryC1/StrS family aminotransferase [Sporosarcina sp. FSL K6-1508]|uniref:DegT/DnrJ/EryC1/StrS family aminotransferase n=1 Tax=Sporosarcina sp. FSL K6-1508 TaxID=2921553 RepID=UPI0030F7A1CF